MWNNDSKCANRGSSFQTSELSKESGIAEEFRSFDTPTTDEVDERYATEYIELGFTGNSSCSDQGYTTLPEMRSLK